MAGPKVLKALDALIAALEEIKEALEGETSKSGGAADAAASRKVSKSGGKAADDELPPARGKSRKASDDDADLDDGDVGDDDDLPPPSKTAAKKTATKKTAAKKSGDDDEITLEMVRDKLTEIVKNEDAGGRPKAFAILKKYGGGVTASADLEEEHFEDVYNACVKVLDALGGGV